MSYNSIDCRFSSGSLDRIHVSSIAVYTVYKVFALCFIVVVWQLWFCSLVVPGLGRGVATLSVNDMISVDGLCLRVPSLYP